MAKGKSKKAGKVSSAEATVSGDAPAKVSVPRGVRKHLRELESQLTDAARKEQKRLEKLERARLRRQTINSALDKLRGRPAATPAPTAATAPAAAAPSSTGKTERTRTGSGRFAAAPRPPAAPMTEPAAADAEKPTN